MAWGLARHFPAEKWGSRGIWGAHGRGREGKCLADDDGAANVQIRKTLSPIAPKLAGSDRPPAHFRQRAVRGPATARDHGPVPSLTALAQGKREEHGGATTNGPDATTPPAICQNSGGGCPAGGRGGGAFLPGAGRSTSRRREPKTGGGGDALGGGGRRSSGQCAGERKGGGRGKGRADRGRRRGGMQRTSCGRTGHSADTAARGEGEGEGTAEREEWRALRKPGKRRNSGRDVVEGHQVRPSLTDHRCAPWPRRGGPVGRRRAVGGGRSGGRSIRTYTHAYTRTSVTYNIRARILYVRTYARKVRIL